MVFYHGSSYKYEIGNILDSSKIKEYDFISNSKSQGQLWKDELIDKSSKNHKRQNSLYAFDNLVYCQAYMESKKESNFFIYKILFPESSKCAYCIPTYLKKEMNEETQLGLSKEYWDPKLDFKIYEYLSNRIEIVDIEKERNPTAKILMNIHLNEDFDLIKKHYV